jgi:hypothetical protein
MKLLRLPPRPLQINENMPRNSGDFAAGPGMRGTWSDVPDVVTLLGEGASGTVQVVQDKWMGRQYASVRMHDNHHA